MFDRVAADGAGLARHRAAVLAGAAPLASAAAAGITWGALRDQVRGLAPALSAPAPGLAGLCAVCHGPAGRSQLCYACQGHSECAPGLGADAVIPVAFAVKGGSHARDLWQYKSARASPGPGGPAHCLAARRLRALLLVFLRDHGPCVWRAAGMPAPTHLAVVPTCRGRPGLHPLRGLAEPFLRCRWADLTPQPGWQPVRDIDPDRFGAARIPGARVLLLDDTWTTGSTAQSAAISLRLAGARSVAIVVLGRHVDQGGYLTAAAMPYRADSCAVHDRRAVTARPWP